MIVYIGQTTENFAQVLSFDFREYKRWCEEEFIKSLAVIQMETSNLIALGALIVAVLALVPSYNQAFARMKNGSSQEPTQNDNSQPFDSEVTTEKEKKPMPYMLRILVMMIMAFATFLIEIIVFGIVAYFFEIEIDINTMPLLWKIIFGSLFIIPGTFAFLAIVILSANSTD